MSGSDKMRIMSLKLDGHAVSHSDNRPLHRQLADLIRTAISSGELRPGEALPSEADLTTALKVSRAVVRQAVDALAAEGLVIKRLGSGTRVAVPPPVRHMATSRYADELTVLRSLKPGELHPLTSAFTTDHGARWREFTVTADYSEDAATVQDAERLDLTPGDPVLRRHLVKYVAGDPVQLQESVIPLPLVEGTPVADPERQPWPGGTIAELYSVGLIVSRVAEEAHARTPSTGERTALGMHAAGPVLEIVRTFYVENRPVECSTAIVEAARCVLRYETELS